MGRLPLAIVVSLAVLPNVALAQAKLPRSIIADDNITITEIRRHSGAVYDACAGADGEPILRSELMAVELPDRIMQPAEQQELLSQLFDLLDENGDDRVTRAEWNSQIDRDLQVADENGDGRVTLKELSNARENVGVGDVLVSLF